MTEKPKAPERERRDWTIILIILLFGFLCVILAGERALRLSPNWKLSTSMDSNINPDSIFLTSRPSGFIEPLDPSILTPPSWFDIFLTPGIVPNTQPPAPTTAITNTPLPQVTNTTTAPTLVVSSTPTSIVIASPTKTLPPFLPTSTSTPVPAISADLQIIKSNGATTYVVGGTTTYAIVVSNPSGPSNVTGATVTDTFPSQISSASWTCVSAGGATCPATGTGNINATVNLPVGSSATFNVTASVSPAATATIINTATITLPVGVTDPVPGNNTASDTDAPILTADLQIAKSNGATSTIVGGTTTYTIVVSNNGPANATNATVTDTFPSQISSASWTCSASGIASCTTSGSGNISDTVNVPVGSSVTYTVTANISPSATGSLVNTANVSSPIDTTPGNNSSTDTDTLITINADLSITKTSPTNTYAPGSAVTYTITVTNNGPNAVIGAIVADNKPTPITTWSWACTSQTGGATGCNAVTNSNANFSDVVDLPNGATITYTVTANTASSATIDLANAASISVPVGYSDPTSSNNSASASHTCAPIADLQITITDNATNYVADAWKIFPYWYEITVFNAGPSDVSGATVSNAFTDGVSGTYVNIIPSSVGWFCTPSTGATCTMSMPIEFGNLNNKSVNLNSGASVTFYLAAQVVAAPSGDLINTATVTEPSGITDPVPSTNTATDSDALFVSSGPTYGNFGIGYDGNLLNLVEGNPIIVTLSPQVQVNGKSGPELIFYEENVGSGINMDKITLELSNGSNWYTILNWGDGNSNPGTSINIPLPAPNPTSCSAEPDDCFIDAFFLTDYLGNGIRTGISIDLDGLVPAGAYPYIRITVPNGSGNAGIDGIYVVP